MVLQGRDCEEGVEAVRVAVIGNIGAFVGRAMDQAAGAMLAVLREHLLAILFPELLVLGQRVAAGVLGRRNLASFQAGLRLHECSSSVIRPWKILPQ